MPLDRIPSSENFCAGKGHLRASVSLSGVWNGRIEVRFARELAIAATAAMMMQPADAVSEADVLDAIREIANMIGGALKSSLPRPCMMALPESGVDEEGLYVQPETGDALAVAFRHEAGGRMVRV